MSNATTDLITATIVEKEIVNTTFIEKEIVSVNFKALDIIEYLEKRIVSGLVQEIPTKLSAVRFQTSLAFVSGSLRVFFNGLKIAIADVTIINSTTFEIEDSTITNDLIEVEYLEL